MTTASEKHGFNQKMEIRRAVQAGIPIFIGYFPAAVAFGILAKGCSTSFVEAVLFSSVVFAGASQFIALNLLMTGMGPAGIILTTLLVNFRHFLMSAYLSTRLKNLAHKTYFLLAFGVTDEVFSVLSFHKEKLTPRFVFFLELSSWAGWVSGTVCGYVLGGFLPDILTQSMGVALYALLLAILLPALKTSRQTVFLAVLSAVLNTLLIWLNLLPDGWTLIVCILVVAFTGALITPEKKETVYE